MELEIIIIVLLVIAVRAAKIVLAMFDGISVVVESGRLIIVLSQRQLRSTPESLSLTRGARLGTLARVSVRLDVLTKGKW